MNKVINTVDKYLNDFYYLKSFKKECEWIYYSWKSLYLDDNLF